ncbi:MFS transporter [Pseudonocardia parietis]|uniref:AAHS family benzoate transporter-like MFS transporter n=1 Tax=Pseudonocardia parietis TaxID=570936 RepID=A0ABS4W2C2_9PSEU|nr:aromatic acid/H+ symport family MFS transporter [Pseudonocardia parietis]MBP2370355.1 AAHS family benzoate transporter-like MFS transporter [Pseudonocardia parietis]
MSAPGPGGRGGLAVVGLCFATIVLDGYDLVVFGATLPVMLRDPSWDMTTAQAGAIGSYALVGMLVGALAVGALTDRLGRRKVVLGTTVWFSVAAGLCAIAPNPEVFGALRFLCGIGLGGMLPTAIALTSEYAPAARRQLYNSVVHVGYSTGGVVATLVAIPLLPVAGWQVMYLLGALPVLVLFPLIYRYLPESPAFLVAHGRHEEARALALRHGLDPDDVLGRETARPVADDAAAGGTPALRETVGELFGPGYRRRSVVFALVGFCGLLLTYGVGTWLPEIMRSAGFALGSALSFLLVLNLGNIVGSLLVARMADRVGSRRVVPAAFATGAVCLVLMAFSPPAVVLYLLVALVGFGAMGAQILVNGFVAASYPARIRATGLGWVVGFSRLGGIAGPVVAGLVLASGVGVGWNFAFFAAFAAAAVLLLLALGPTGEPAAAVPGNRSRDGNLRR